MIRPLALAALLAVMVNHATAESDPVRDAKRAAQALDHAALALQQADKARDRIAALTQTVQAYEAGLSALRDGMRRAAIREQALQNELAARRAEIAQLTGVLQTMQRSPESLLLLHPSGPLGTARSGMLLADVTPALQQRAEALSQDLNELTLLRGLQDSAADTVKAGLLGAQTARTALSQAVSDRRDLPRRFTTDPEAMRLLLESTDTLEGFAAGLADLGGPAEADMPLFEARHGALPMPVQGTVLRRFNEADAAGIRRPGLLVAARPLALVTTPAPATIRYRGPLLDYGNVMILEPAGGYLLVLAGMQQVYGSAGEVLPQGAPIGLMGGKDPKIEAFLADPAEGGGTERSETLYMELRQGDTPIDPAGWFGLNKE